MSTHPGHDEDLVLTRSSDDARPAPDDTGGHDRGGDDLGWDDEDDFVSVRSGGSRLARSVVALLVLVVIGFVLYRGVRGWFQQQLDPAGPPGETVAFVVPTGATTAEIASLLEDQEIVPNSTFFRYYADWKGASSIQAGEYEMQVNSSASEAIAVLTAGPIPPVYTTLQVREGLWLNETLAVIAEQVPDVTVEELQAVLDSGQLDARYRPEGATSWEGLLFPANYELETDATAAQILGRMNASFAQVTGEIGYGGSETSVGRPAYDVLIIASMVEAEAKTDADRPKIARVIYNRLQEQMSLDIDATCIYGAQDRQVELTRNMMTEGDYACRNNPNLPPTPISMPGEASLRAALQPEEGDWLYYVLADAEGNHFFTDDYDEFQAQVQKSRDEGLF
ncbi:MAG: endolytic transglycosylase MltG [Acidimicrobiales bacterium]